MFGLVILAAIEGLFAPEDIFHEVIQAGLQIVAKFTVFLSELAERSLFHEVQKEMLGQVLGVFVGFSPFGSNEDVNGFPILSCHRFQGGILQGGGIVNAFDEIRPTRGGKAALMASHRPRRRGRRDTGCR